MMVNSSWRQTLNVHIFRAFRILNSLYIMNILSLSLYIYIYIYIYIYMYIYCQPQTDCFIVLQLFSVARHIEHLKLGLKPAQLYVRLCLRPLSQQAYHIS